MRPQYTPSMKQFASIALLALLCTPARLHSQAPLEWSWFRATTAANDWWITRGRADVTMTGGTFAATLWEGNEQKFARLSLKGAIRHGVAKVRVTVNNTDVDPFPTSGKLRRFCWDGGGREELVLSDGSEVIGLFRELFGGRCVPTK
jgi:hypothetical protein